MLDVESHIGADPAVYDFRPIQAALQASAGHHGRGRQALRERRFPEAATAYRAAIAALPRGYTDGALWNDLGLSLLRDGDLAGAVEAYGRALAAKPWSHQVRYGAALPFLASGDLARGWPLYASRLYRAGARRLRFAAPALSQLPRAGERVVLWADQGVGDQVMFASLLPDLLATGAVLTVACQARLVPLLQRSVPEIEVVADTDPSLREPRFDAHAALADCARWLRPGLRCFPGTPYLLPDRALAAVLRRRYKDQAGGRPLVGISWRTLSPKIPAEKSAPLQQWRPILGAGAAFVNLQYGDVLAELAAARESTAATILDDRRIDPMVDLDSFSAQVAAMDLVITTSNVTAHMAGALGVPAIVLVPKGMGAIWHWFDGRSDSPWYGSVRLVRQATRGNWTMPIAGAAALMRNRFGLER